MAAGQGYIEFATGDVLTAAAANGYLASQVVMVFASSTARTTAITSPQEGMMSYLKDTNVVEVYDGSAWVGVANSGDITGVTAGTGISGGGTSGTVTVTNSMATAIDAKGDLVVGTGADAFSRLAVGTNNQVLTADSSTATGLKWATAAGGGGKVLQVVQFTTATASTVTSSTFTDTNITLSITPSASTSKVMVIASCATQYFTNGAGLNQVGMGLRLKRGATVVFDPSGNGGEAEYITDSENSYKQMSAFTTFSYLDSPATTSSTTYTIAIRNNSGTNTAKTSPDSRESSLILMEIGA